MDSRKWKAVVALLCCVLLKVVVCRDESKSELQFLIGIGAQKSGTTTFSRILANHPQIIPGRSKELHFWYQDKGKHATLDSYLEYFEGLKNETDLSNKVLFEFTPAYFAVPHTPKRIHKVIPNAKFLLIFREPISRWQSELNMYRRFCAWNTKKKPTCCSMFVHSQDIVDANIGFLEKHEECRAGGNPFDCAIEWKNPFLRSLYASRFKLWFKYFDPSQFLILHYEDMKDENAAIRRVTDFIGLKPYTVTSKDTDVAAMSANHYYSDVLGKPDARMVKFFDEENKEMYRILGENGFNFTPFKPYKPHTPSVSEESVKDRHEAAIACCQRHWKKLPFAKMDSFCRKTLLGDKMFVTDLHDISLPNLGSKKDPMKLKHSAELTQKPADVSVTETGSACSDHWGIDRVSLLIFGTVLGVVAIMLYPRRPKIRLAAD